MKSIPATGAGLGFSGWKEGLRNACWVTWLGVPGTCWPAPLSPSGPELAGFSKGAVTLPAEPSRVQEDCARAFWRAGWAGHPAGLPQTSCGPPGAQKPPRPAAALSVRACQAS